MTKNRRIEPNQRDDFLRDDNQRDDLLGGGGSWR